MERMNRRRYLQLSGAAAGAPLLGSRTAQGLHTNESNDGPPQPVDLRVEYEKEPDNLPPRSDPVEGPREPFAPRFSWRVPTDERAAGQRAYRVLVAASPEELSPDASGVRDSGKVESARSSGVTFEAAAGFDPEETYYWTVRVWDEDGSASPWSEPAGFGTAIDDAPEEWEGSWITTNASPASPEPKRAGPARNERSPLLRNEFDLEKEVDSAHLHVVTLGYGEVYVNGERIGDRQLDSPRTQYLERVLFSTYDVSDALGQGTNALGLWLGRGWFSKDKWNIATHAAWTLPTTTVDGATPADVSHHGGFGTGRHGAPTALLQLNVEYADGTTDSVATDTSWQTHPSPIVGNDIYQGEIYNALQEQPGWAESGFDDSAWTPAVEHPFYEGPNAADPAIRPQRTPPIEVTETLEPEEIYTVGGDYVIDFGQEFPGWIELSIPNPGEGTVVRIKHAERVYEDGDIDRRSNRKASAEDVYVTKGADEEVYEPRFTYHAFRYAKVENYPGELTAENVTGKVVHTAFEQTGSFACSNEDLTRIQQNSVWGLRSNSHSIPTDCCQRDERFGWTGDAAISAPADLWNFDAVRFWEKWQRDHTDSQHENGSLRETVPNVPDSANSETNWTRTRAVIPWYLYRHTGDERVLAAHYESMKAYADFWYRTASQGLQSGDRSRDHIVPASEIVIGDHGAPEGARQDPALVGTFGYYHITETVAKAAEVLGEDADVAKYGDRTRAIAEAFNAEFFDSATATYGSGLQKSYALPLFLGIVPGEHEDAVVENFVAKIEADGNVLQTGFVSTRPLLFSLVEYDHEELAYHIASQPEQPGWVFMLRNDATTNWEHWDILDRYEEPASDMTSHNHRNYNLISEWFYRELAGIEIGDPGFEHVEIDPTIVDDLEWAEGTTETVRGEVASRWEKTAEGLELDVTVPWNATATVRVPDLGAEAVRLREGNRVVWNEGGAPGSLPEGIESVRREDDAVVVEVGSGDYAFSLSTGSAA